MGNNVRYFPSTLPDVRTHDLHLLDLGLYKTFTLPRDIDLQIRVEAINALNYTVLWNPTWIRATRASGSSTRTATTRATSSSARA